MLLAVVAGAWLVALPAPANAANRDYVATATFPVAPSSSYAGGGGGDGWDISLTPTAVFNVFHHQTSLQVACHKQSDASACGPARTIVDDQGNGFYSSGQSGTYIDQATSRLFTYATRPSDGSAGVVCVDVAVIEVEDNGANPFCGYTKLTADNAAAVDGGHTSAPIKIGSKWLAFNYYSGAPAAGGANAILCFDLVAQAACAGQPYDIGAGAETFSNGTWPAPATSVAGGRLIVPFTIDGASKLTCWDPDTSTICPGAWPIDISSSYPGLSGSAFPVLDGSGHTLGLCLPLSDADSCFDLAGAHLDVPANLVTTLTDNEGWNGPPVVLGSRVYLANGSVDAIQCYDFASQQDCPNFPRSTDLGDLGSAGYLYTVNRDPQRPECLWLNADYGSAQIQSFDAFSGGACGSGGVRVLVSNLVAPGDDCMPRSYQDLTILSPARDGYDAGTVSFLDGSGQAIPGLDDVAIDADGSVDLSGANLEDLDALPQFLISLDRPDDAELSSVSVQLRWTADSDASCEPPSTIKVSPQRSQVGETVAIDYTCPTAPTVEYLRPDGSAADDDLTVADRVIDGAHRIDYVTSSAVGTYYMRMDCAGVEAVSPLFTVVGSVDGVFGPGWPQDPSGAVDLVWSYAGQHRYLGNIFQGATNWNEAGTNVHMSEWQGDSTPVDISVADVTTNDDYWGWTLTTDGFSKMFTRNFIFMNTTNLDPENDFIRTKVSTHEFGHALGLTHPDDAGLQRGDEDSVMWQGRLPYNTPQAYDVARLEQRYQ